MRLLAPSAHVHRAARLFPSTTLRRLVLQHADACRQVGLSTEKLEDETDEAVLEWLDARSGLLPFRLVEDLERIEELTDERGAEALLDVAEEAGVDLRLFGLDPLQVAVAAFLDKPALFEQAHGRRVVETLRGSAEFAGRRVVGGVQVDLAKLQELEVAFGRHFDARSRTAHCRIILGRDGDRLIFTVCHGGLAKADEALDEHAPREPAPADAVHLPEQVIRYRPQRRDIVVYDTRAGSIRLRAPDAATLQVYRRGFGELLHRDPDWFGEGPVVSLAPLVHDGAAVEVPTPGLRAVRVVGLIVRYEDGSTIAVDSADIWPFLAERVVDAFTHGELLEVTFRVWRVGHPKAALVRVREPNRVEYGRVAEAVFRPYLEARGFLSRMPSRKTG